MQAQVQLLKKDRDDKDAKLQDLHRENESLKVAAMGNLKRPTGAPTVAAALTPSVPGPTRSDPSSMDIPKKSWADAGFATPEAALETRGWAILNGDRNRFAQSLSITPEARKTLEDMIVQMAASSKDPSRDVTIQEALKNNWGVEEGILMPMMALNQQHGFEGYRVLSQQQISDDQMLLEVETQMDSAPAVTDTLKMQRIGDDWKVVIDEDWLKSRQ